MRFCLLRLGSSTRKLYRSRRLEIYALTSSLLRGRSYALAIALCTPFEVGIDMLLVARQLYGTMEGIIHGGSPNVCTS